MQISVNQFDPNINADCIILPIYPDKKQSLITAEFNNHNNNIITQLYDNKELTGKHGEIRWLYNISPKYKSVLTVGIGDLSKLSTSKYLALVNKALEYLTNRELKVLINGLLDVELKSKNTTWQIQQLILAAADLSNRPRKYQKKQPSSLNVEHYYLTSGKPQLEEALENIDVAKIINTSLVLSKATTRAKDLANMPANICNPAYLAEQAQNLASSHSNLSCTIYQHEQLQEIGMGAFCSVSQGSNHPGNMIFLEYNGAANKSDQPYVLIGKGITFDTGGYTLKPPKSMVGMKYDMCGAASVLATMQAVSELNLPINVVGILACAENMVGHKSTRPDDIVTSLKGLTIEINNTDAEGRLVLCDALTYSEKFKPKVIIDIATLTGAAVMALGYQYTATYTNQDQLKQDLLAAANKTHDPIWPMPICEEYHELMQSTIADLQNSSNLPVAGSITATCFLSNFVPEKTAWAHLDIAGTATVRADHAEATGRPVPLLLHYLIDQCAQNPQ